MINIKIPILNEKQIFENLELQKNPFFAEYYAFYSSWFGGIVTNPRMMLLPIDDHMVHRGDGVFEAIKVVKRSVYLLDEHLHRLLHSAERIELKSSLQFDDMKQVILETLRVANQNDAFIRAYLSRGPGNFSVNPYDSIAAQFYVVITKLKLLSEEKYARGVKIGKSAIPGKDSWMAQVKSCNYLPNVMMKKESVDRDLDFVVSIDEKGFITEGPTENIMIVDAKGILVHPGFDYILKGITMTRASELARENKIMTMAKPISLEDLLSAREVMMSGTTLDLLPVVEFEDRKIGDGKPGPVTRKLRELILEDINVGPRRTQF